MHLKSLGRPKECTLAAIIVGALCCVGCWGPESPGEKKSNAFLQQVEFETREAGPVPRLLVKRSADNQYCAAGFWSEDIGKRVWVLIQPASNPPKVIPEGTFELLPGDEDVIVDQCRLAESAASLRERLE